MNNLRNFNIEQFKLEQNNIIDIIILDLDMPISNGFEACKNILKLYD